jgi:hypothetical protein
LFLICCLGEFWQDITLFLYGLRCLDLGGSDALREIDVQHVLKQGNNLRAVSFRSCFRLSGAFVEKILKHSDAARSGIVELTFLVFGYFICLICFVKSKFSYYNKYYE